MLCLYYKFQGNILNSQYAKPSCISGKKHMPMKQIIAAQ